MRLRIWGLLVVLMLVVSGGSLASAQDQPLKVVATYSMLGDVVQNVGGSSIDLTVLVGAGGDTHSYEPVPQDSVALGSAALLFENGLGYETWLDDLYSASGSTAERIAVSDGIIPGTITVGDEAGETDPHIWQNLYNFVHVAETVRDTLAAADPANATTYQLNANAYLQQLLDTDSYVIQQTQTIPADQRKLVTDHDAFGYFAARYGFTIVGTALGSASTEGAEPSAADIAALVGAIKDTGTRAIFPENIENASLVDQLAGEAGVVVGAPLCSDALTPADGPCPTYVTMMRYNIDSIVAALQ
jgi:zinc/manganese transport system substrate-binding protein